MNLIAVQLDIAWENRPENYRRVEQMLASVPDVADALIILPEMFDVGFSMNTAVTAPPPDRDAEQFLRALAARRGATVLGGVVGTCESQLTNEAVAFDAHGQELVRYRKQQPFSLAHEGQHYLRGDSHRLFQWNSAVVAPFICYDLRFPERFRRAARDGAELFVVIACWPAKRSEHWVRLLQARAIENQAFVVGVNRCGQDPEFTYDGRSCLIDPQGNVRVETDAAPQVVVASIDINEVRTWRAKFPALRDMGDV